MTPPEVVSFDCYGTLVDWQGGIARAVIAAAAAEGLTLHRTQVLQAHAEIEPVVQAERFRSYREILCETVLRMARRFDWELTADRAVFLPQSLADWTPFADTNPALQRLVDAGCRLAILSNVDDDLLTATLRQLQVPFDRLITAEQVGSYKPAPGHFLAARSAFGDARWLHAAQSWFHDVEPACALGIPVVWVNRHDDEAAGAARPQQTVGDLTQLADYLVGQRRGE